MKTLKDYFDNDTLAWLHDKGFGYKLADIKVDKGELNIIYNDKFALKLYDRMGHGFGVTTNVADKYDETIYTNDNFSLTWAFEYFKINETANFSGRQLNEYEQNLGKLVSDIKSIIPRLILLTPLERRTMVDWIKKESRRRFG